ncbi:hypothetical protein LCGC14_2286220 [marine sediment metagenome]|uniref:Peptidase C-terminal archaeal/bacterial domain-containing protein n=1 Tax=marine sediment metagenome TaxID=412755 RepID=A0A0F9CSF6_9ZZZZ
MKLRKNMKLGVSFLFLLLTLTSCLSLINLTKKNNSLDENTPSLSLTTDDLYEENDDWLTATDLTSYEGWWLSSINGSGFQWDDDWYKININSGKEHIRIMLMFEHFLGDIDLQLYNSSFTWSFSRTSTTDNEFMDITVPWSGIYYIKVYFENAGNPYDLKYNFLIK